MKFNYLVQMSNSNFVF